jgi:uncharacterized protein (TIGR02453 family)
MIASGIYMPPPDVLASLRKLITSNYKEYEKIISAKDFKKEFKEVWGGDDKLKSVPKGFDKGHPAVEHLKNKSYIVYKMIPDEKVVSKGYADYAAKLCKVMKPFNDFLNRAF